MPVRPTDADLPAGYSWRHPTAKDAAAIFAMTTAYNEAIVGYADCTLDDILDGFEDPDFDATADGWVVHDRAGALAGNGWACRNGDSDLVHIEATSPDDSVAGWLLGQARARGQNIVAGLGHPTVTLSIGIYRDDHAQRQRAAALGFAPATTYHRMRIDHHAPPVDPDLPDGATLRTGPGDTAFLRDAHAVLNASFADHIGFVARSLQDWRELIESSTTHDWSQLRVVDIEGEPVAMLLTNDQFVEDENCGYVAHVGVRPDARGRGLARFLLRQAFAEDARRGRTGTLLHVDTNNVTPALGLYLAVGMRPVLVIDVWNETVPAATD